MKNIAFYLPGDGLENIDLTRPEEGNPGIGGTEYCEILLAYYLSISTASYKISIISHRQLQLPASVDSGLISGFDELKFIDCRYDILILKTPRKKNQFDILNSFGSTRVITWSHNYFNHDVARWITKSRAIALNVFVGAQMFDFYIDDDVICKSIWIFNIVQDTLGECHRYIEPDTLTFMGSIALPKGIMQLLKIWEIVERAVPDARLNIIGGANLYDRNIKSGKYGIADELTESKIIRYIADEEGKIKSSINFLGILGKEKFDIFRKSSVGIVNPSAKTETFGLGIIEMATAKLPVVTLNWNGHPDTALNNQTALLGYSIRDMADKIIRLFKDDMLNQRLGEEAKSQVKRFSPERIVPIWENTIEMVLTNQIQTSQKSISRPYWNNYKFIRLFNSFLRFDLKLKFLPSIVEIETLIHRLLTK